MKVQIKTGFERVTHILNFNPEGEPKGKKLVESGHVRDVCEFREGGESYLIEAKVIRKTNDTLPPYTTKLYLDGVRNIVNVSCTCSNNKSLKCKHVAALIHFFNNVESRSKTDIEQQWGGVTPLQFAKEKYSKGKHFYERFSPSDKKVVVLKQKAYEVTDEGPTAPSAFKMMVTVMNERIKNNLNGDLEKEIAMKAALSLVEAENDKIVSCLEILFALFEKQEVQHCVPVIPPELLEFYVKTIVLTKQEINQLCCNTVKQSDNSDWFKARRIRISASRNAHNIKSRKTKTIEKLIGEMLHPLKVDNAATRYGKKMESAARTEYECSTGTYVQQVGVLVCRSKPWLCASLDGVVMLGSQPSKVIEIKCPLTCEKMAIFDSDSKKINVNYLQLDKDIVVLKKSSVIYTQCQIQMYASGLSQCDLYVYSPIKSCIVSVTRDDKFLRDVLLKCEQFYFEHYLSALQICAKNDTCAPSGVRKFTGTDISNIVNNNP